MSSLLITNVQHRTVGLFELGVSLLIAALFGLCGCAATRPALTLDPVGPRGSGFGLANQGYLQVFSETEAHDVGRIIYYSHSSYSIYTTTNKYFKGVINHAGNTDQSAMVVTLPAGKYQVVARAEGYGLVTVPVVIVGGKTTILYLERSGMPETQDLTEAELVRFPQGYVIGCRAKERAVRSTPSLAPKAE